MTLLRGLRVWYDGVSESNQVAREFETGKWKAKEHALSLGSDLKPDFGVHSPYLSVDIPSTRSIAKCFILLDHQDKFRC